MDADADRSPDQRGGLPTPKSHLAGMADTGGVDPPLSVSPSITRDADATRARILDAASDEFAEKGRAGARIARIAERAHANQRMIYAYFNSKDLLFDAVLEHHVLTAQDDIQLDPADIATYATRLFEMYERNPRLARLELWQALERPGLAASLPAVDDAMTEKVALIGGGQRAGTISDAVAPAALLDQILALVRGNTSLSAEVNADRQQRRRDLIIAVRRLTAPDTADET